MPNSKWCMDFTYIYYGGKKTRYNCTVIDLYSRKVVASVCGNRIDTQLAINTVEAALRHCKGQFNGILHSDRGCQFTSQRFVEYCKSKGITQSMSKSGCPYDNAPMERYFNTTSMKQKRSCIEPLWSTHTGITTISDRTPTMADYRRRRLHENCDLLLQLYLTRTHSG